MGDVFGSLRFRSSPPRLRGILCGRSPACRSRSAKCTSMSWPTAQPVVAGRGALAASGRLTPSWPPCRADTSLAAAPALKSEGLRPLMTGLGPDLPEVALAPTGAELEQGGPSSAGKFKHEPGQNHIQPPHPRGFDFTAAPLHHCAPLHYCTTAPLVLCVWAR